ncbi:MAG: lysophospholipid acyltransferase family protein [Gemmatimonadota bacterium]
MSMLYSLWVWLSCSFLTFIWSSLTLIGGLFGAGQRYMHWIESNWGKSIIWASLIKVEAQGLEHLRMDQPQIVASNHQSWFDVFSLAAKLPKKFRFVAKEELSRIPLFGRAWRICGHISVNRSDRLQAIRILGHWGDVVRNDNSIIVIFPEGTRSATGELLPFKKGAFMLALHTHVDIVPTAVIGSSRVLPKGDWRVRKGRIIVRFGEPIPTVGYTEKNREELVALVRERIQQLKQQVEPA